MSLLSTHDLKVGYDAKPFPKEIQRNLNLEIKAGQIVSLMGQNGVGKTTFIKSITGLLPILSGEVKIGGKNLEGLSPSTVARQVSVVLTEKPASFNLSVVEMLALGRHPYSNWMGVLRDADKRAIDQAIDDCKINYIADKKLYELSDGQLQKVMIARALAQETHLIILDEPAAHLDLANKLEVMMLLRQIAEQGKGVLISTHDIQLSTQLSDELWLFNFNDQVSVGIPEDLILDGSLEKALFLSGYNYDLIYGTLADQDKSFKSSIKLQLPEKEAYWARKALYRNQIAISERAELILGMTDGKWTLTNGSTDESFENLEALTAFLAQTRIKS